MVQTAFIQKHYHEDIYWWSYSCGSAATGFEELGYKVASFVTGKIEEVPLAKNRPVRGSVYSVRRALELLGIPQPENVDIPAVLKPFVGREIWTSTLRDVRLKNELVFIKPLSVQKGFSGHIYYGDKSSTPYPDRITKGLPEDYKILCQEPVHWLKEWRVYVLNGKIVGVRHYRQLDSLAWSQNDLEKLKPNYQTIRKMISALGKTAPAGFSLDVGVMHGKKGTYLVEMNDGFSIGNYGIPNKIFARLIEARWKELVRIK